MASNKPVIHGSDHRRGGPDPVGDTDGLFFGQTNQGAIDGGWLWVQTRDVNALGGDGDGYGMYLADTSGGGIKINAGDATFDLWGGNDLARLQLSNPGGNGFFAGIAHDFSFNLGGAGGGGEFHINSNVTGSPTLVQVEKDGTFHLRGAVAGVVTEILRVDAAGVYHILTGASWTADL